jgi:SAM-dependent methyltransferase
MNKTCKVSGKSLIEVMNFGKMPLGNGFLPISDFDNEYFYDMRIGFCETSKMVQLIDQPSPNKMFHERYAFFTGTSQGMKEHFRKHASNIKKKYLHNDSPFVVEIGSNDGSFLEYFSQRQIKHLGIDPSKNVADAAREKGVECICEFFSSETAEKVIVDYQHADVITAANVICHIPNFNEVLTGVEKLLKKSGIFIFEEPYLGDVISKTSYDQFYDEHVFIFSALSVNYAAELNGLELIDLEHLETHGGSMRYYLGKKGVHTPTQLVSTYLNIEKKSGLDRLESLMGFKQNCEESRLALKEILEKFATENIPVVGYAATSKSTTVIQYCGITTKHLQYICDTTPIKHNKFSPGAHIPIRSYDYYKENLPEYALLFAWNHSEEIMEKEKAFRAQNGKWIQYVPTISIK